MEYNISKYGGKADGQKDCSAALEKLINEVIDEIQNNKNPVRDRRIELPQGDYYFSRPLDYAAAASNGIEILIRGTVRGLPKDPFRQS